MAHPLSVAIVGSGPSGAYCARLLSEDGSLDARVDVYERLPAPYGLVRYGVAPDHQKIKSITASLAEILEHPRVRFVGNVAVGSDVSLDGLRRHYDAVILACGASVGRRLGITGEDLPGVFSATEIGTNRPDAGETVRTLVDDMRAAPLKHAAAAGDPVDLLGLGGKAVVDWAGWRAIDRAEREYGERLGRDRVKLHDRTRLLDAASAVSASEG